MDDETRAAKALGSMLRPSSPTDPFDAARQEEHAARAMQQGEERMRNVQAHLANNPNQPAEPPPRLYAADIGGGSSGGGGSSSAAAASDVPDDSWSSGDVRDWLRKNSIGFNKDDDLPSLIKLAREEAEALAEEARAMAEWEAAQARRGQVISAVSADGADRTWLDAARDGEETARMEMMQAAAAAAAPPVPVVEGRAVKESEVVAPAGAGAVQVVQAVAVPADAVLPAADVPVAGGLPTFMTRMHE